MTPNSVRKFYTIGLAVAIISTTISSAHGQNTNSGTGTTQAQTGTIEPDRTTSLSPEKPGQGKLKPMNESAIEKDFHAKYKIKPQQKVRAYINKATAGMRFPALSRSTFTLISDLELTKIFPDRLFYALRFM